MGLDFDLGFVNIYVGDWLYLYRFICTVQFMLFQSFRKLSYFQRECQSQLWLAERRSTAREVLDKVTLFIIKKSSDLRQFGIFSKFNPKVGKYFKICVLRTVQRTGICTSLHIRESQKLVLLRIKLESIWYYQKTYANKTLKNLLFVH